MSFQPFRLWLTPDQGAETLVIPDGLMRELHSDTAAPTQFPVGKGSVITDHFQVAPAFFSCEILVTDVPINPPETQGTPGWGYVGTPARAPDGTVYETTRPAFDLDRTRRVYAELLKAQRAGVLFRINSTLRTYRNMALTNVDLPRDTQGTDVTIQLDFVEIRRATSREVLIEVVPEPKLRSKTERGNQEASEVEPETDAAGGGESLLSAALRGIGGLFGG